MNTEEVMYQASLHPEKYSNTFSDEQIKQLGYRPLYRAYRKRLRLLLVMYGRVLKRRMQSRRRAASSKPRPKAVKEEDDEADEEQPAKSKRGRKNVKQEVEDQAKGAKEEKIAERPKRASKKVKEAVKAESIDEAEETKPLKKQKPTTNSTFKQSKTAANAVKSEDRAIEARGGPVVC
ncbi:hypothetical protein BDW02DRAFT_565905 [Decorospora gaudefroyi]|uniref:Uncharacterized protein n=1 Tax=Decorospora gaudefroyi TaxID=184978 RepID=A0A6A5KT04_9PLEO|nr:hypothetical protein BDW02DRAFT_565905 [Decorospora gaudefroyi]